MAKHKFKELSSCVRGERFKYTFSGVCEQYVALLTEDEYEIIDFEENAIHMLCRDFSIEVKALNIEYFSTFS